MNTVPTLQIPNDDSPPALARVLEYRHIRLIAIGGAIGAGLFLGSGHAIAKAGPALVVAYALAGIFIFVVMRALGEILLSNPGCRSLSDLADEMLGPWAGYITGWSYWMNWILVGIAELTAIGLLVHTLYPALPQWAPALTTLVLLSTFNYLSVKNFGEVEFWMAIIKVITIACLILVGIYLIATNIGNPTGPSVSNLWQHGGFFAAGYQSFLLALPIAAFSFGGMEIIGLLAAETKDLKKTLPKSINGVLLRIAIFYMGSLAIVMCLFPWNQIDPNQSPFVLAFTAVGLQDAANIIMIVVITSIASSCNSGLYATSRSLFSLAVKGHAPKAMLELSNRNVPTVALSVSIACMLIGVALNIFFPNDLFGYLMAGILLLLLWIWTVILVAHIKHRRHFKGEKSSLMFKLPGYPAVNYICLSFIVLLGALVIIDPETRIAGVVFSIWMAGLTIAFLWKPKVDYKFKRAANKTAA
ncbi:amino acid permease [Pseudomonas sp. S2_A02]